MLIQLTNMRNLEPTQPLTIPQTANHFKTVLLWIVLILLVTSCSDQPDLSEATVEPTATTASTEPSPQEIIVTRIVEQQTAPISIATPDIVKELTELDVGQIGDVATLDPTLVESVNELNLAENLFVGLTRLNGRTQEIEPMLATDWQVSVDGLTWTFELRDDIPWIRPISANALPAIQNSNDLKEVQTVRPIIADDFVYAIRRACSPESSAPDVTLLFLIEGCEDVQKQSAATAADLSSIAVTALSPSTLQIRLVRPASYFLTITTMPIMRPVPTEVVAANESDWSLPENGELVSSGPFFLSPNSIAGTRLVLNRNPFWPISFNGNVDIVNVYQFDTRMAAYDLWQDRNLDIADLPGSIQEAVQEDTPQKVTYVPEQAVFYLGYNYQSQVFRIPELRRAFGAAIDRERIVEEVYEMQGAPARHFTPPGVFGAPAVTEIGVGFDPDYARLQLIASGVSACQFLPPIRYMVNSSDAALFQAELVRDMWNEVLGCPKENIIIEQVQFGALLANTRQEAGNLRPDVWDLGWASYYPDAHNWFMDVLHCSESDNRVNRPCDEVDDLIKRAGTTDPDMRRQLYRRIESELFGTEGSAPITPIYVRGRYLVRQTWVVFDPATFGGEQYDRYVVDWELKKIEKQQ